MPLLSDYDDYDYDDSSEEGTPDLLSTILKQMMGGADIEITQITGSSEEGASEESSGSSDSVEVTVEATTPKTEIAAPRHSDSKDKRVPEEVSYRRAP